MTGEWYCSSREIKKYFEERGKFESLQNQLVDRGILLEGDFNGLITSQFVKKSQDALAELFLNDECEYGDIGSTIDYLEEGWLYYLYDANKLTHAEAKKMADSHFRKKLKIKC